MNRRRFTVTMVVASIFVALMISPAAAEPVGPQIHASGTQDAFEPNDSRATATAVEFNSEHMWIYFDLTFDKAGSATAGDQDYFRLGGKAGQFLYVSAGRWSPLEMVIALYKSNGTLIASTKDKLLTYKLPSDGNYYVRIRSADYPNGGGPEYGYTLWLVLGDIYEPNDTLDEATPIVYGETIAAYTTEKPTLGAPCGFDCDYYVFAGHRGDHILALMDASSNGWDEISLLDQDGTELLRNYNDSPLKRAFIQATLPADGMYYLKVGMYSGEGYGPFDYELVVDKAILVSSSRDGIVDNMAFGRADILAYLESADQWRMLQDASTLGVDRNINSLAFPFQEWWGDLLITLQGSELIDGVVLRPQDVILAHPLDMPNPYSFAQPHSMLDGSDVGLTLQSEAIDAVAVAPDGRLLISTVGAARVPGVAAQNEDLLAFAPAQWEWDGVTTGRWSLFLDGSTIPGLAGEDVGAASVDALGTVYLALKDAYVVGGVACDARCILEIGPDGVVTKFWDGRDHRFNFPLDAIDVPSQVDLQLQP